MPLTPSIVTSVNITARDINGNNKPKQFNSVGSLTFDYVKGMVSLVDLVQGQFYFPLIVITSLTYTVAAGAGAPVTTVVMF